MFDGLLKKPLDPVLNKIGEKLASIGLSANAITIIGFLIGVGAAIGIIFEAYLIALALILASRLCDGLDGAIARATKPTDFGGFLDITLDFAFYGLIPLAFIVANPSDNALAGSILLLSFYVNGSSFLAFAIMAQKQSMSTDQRGQKSLFFSTGLTEASETLALFVIWCLWPQYFAVSAYVFAALVAYTTLSRVILARRAFQ